MTVNKTAKVFLTFWYDAVQTVSLV